MGKVFSPEELRAGQIPVEGAHTAAADFIVEQLFYDQKAFSDDPLAFIETAISSGMVHGSATHGTATIRSDIDTVVILRYHDVSTLDTIRSVFAETQSRYNVPIEANLLSLDDVHEKTHRIDPLFLRYLFEAQENSNYSWNWPASSIGSHFSKHDYSQISLARVNQRYTAAKSASFAKALTLEGDGELHRLQRALELPKNLGRKILAMCDANFSAWSTSTDEILSGLDSFVEGRAFAYDREYGSDLKSKLRSLLEYDSEYSDLLAQTISEDVSIQTYEEWLNARKRDVFFLALQICGQTQTVLMRYMRELRSDDWEAEKTEMERRIAEVDLTSWDDAY